VEDSDGRWRSTLPAPTPWVLRGAAKRQLGRAAEAERDVAHALSLAPDDAEALLERAALRRARGDVRGRAADWERAARSAPDAGPAELAAAEPRTHPSPTPQRRQR
jgi:Flp pilus assembly protein TadD